MPVGSIGGARQHLSAQGFDPSQIRERFQQSGLQNQAQEKLASALTSEGIDQEAAANLQSDIQAAVQTQLESGSPNPTEFEAVLRDAFEKNGVDFDATKSRIQDSFGGAFPGAGGRGFPGGGGFGLGQLTAGDNSTDLFTLLEQVSSNQGSSGALEFEDPTQDLTETFIDALFGIDEEA